MNTINISLPPVLKKQADALITAGHYASFSDLVRTAIRQLMTETIYDREAREAMEEYKKGKSTVLRDKKDIAAFVKQHMP